MVAALPQLEEARIGTIHSFCADLLRERRSRPASDPLFEVAANEARALFDRAFDRWFDEQLRAPSQRDANPPPALERAAAGGARAEPRALLKNAPGPRRAAGLPGSLAVRRTFRARARDRRAVAAMAALAARSGEVRATTVHAFAPRDPAIRRRGRRRETLGARDYDGSGGGLAEISPRRRARFWNWKGWRAAPELRETRDRLHSDC